MKVLVASVFALLAVLLLNTVMVSASAELAVAKKASSCHNATGSCSETLFVCANEEMIPHSRRCDGVEDCADGTDEYMCDSEHFHADKPVTEMTVAARTALTEVSCIKCTCYKGQITITTGSTNTLTLNVYKKQNKGCR